MFEDLKRAADEVSSDESPERKKNKIGEAFN